MTRLDKTTENMDGLSKRFCENLNDAVCSGNCKALQLFTETCIGLLEYYTPRVIYEHLIGLPFDIDFYVDWKNVSDDMNLLDTVDRKVAVVIHYSDAGAYIVRFWKDEDDERKITSPAVHFPDRDNLPISTKDDETPKKVDRIKEFLDTMTALRNVPDELLNDDMYPEELGGPFAETLQKAYDLMFEIGPMSDAELIVSGLWDRIKHTDFMIEAGEKDSFGWVTGEVYDSATGRSLVYG